MDNNIAQKVLREIKDKKIEPKPIWQFWGKNILVWLFFILSVMAGAVAVAVIIFVILNSDWEACHEIAGGQTQFLLKILPLFWLLVLTLLVLVSLYNFRHTKKGYKYNIIGVVILSIGSSLILGGVSYILGIGEIVEYQTARHIPLYQGHAETRMKMWNQTDRGLLAGRILRVHEKELDLQDLQANNWQVKIDEAVISPVVVIREGNMIRVIGKNKEGNLFVAERIMPWQGPGEKINWQIKIERKPKPIAY